MKMDAMLYKTKRSQIPQSPLKKEVTLADRELSSTLWYQVITTIAVYNIGNQDRCFNQNVCF